MAADPLIPPYEADIKRLVEALRALLSDVDFKSKAEHDARKLLQQFDGGADAS